MNIPQLKVLIALLPPVIVVDNGDIDLWIDEILRRGPEKATEGPIRHPRHFSSFNTVDFKNIYPLPSFRLSA